MDFKSYYMGTMTNGQIASHNRPKHMILAKNGKNVSKLTLIHPLRRKYIIVVH